VVEGHSRQGKAINFQEHERLIPRQVISTFAEDASD